MANLQGNESRDSRFDGPQGADDSLRKNRANDVPRRKSHGAALPRPTAEDPQVIPEDGLALGAARQDSASADTFGTTASRTYPQEDRIVSRAPRRRVEQTPCGRLGVVARATEAQQL